MRYSDNKEKFGKKIMEADSLYSFGSVSNLFDKLIDFGADCRLREILICACQERRWVEVSLHHEIRHNYVLKCMQTNSEHK